MTMKHNLMTWINTPVEDQRWLMWPEVNDAIKAPLDGVQGDIYTTIHNYLKNYFTVTVDFSQDSDITAYEMHQLIKSVPRQHRNRFSLWGVNDAVRVVLMEVMGGK